jgi:hypothetical protein
MVLANTAIIYLHIFNTKQWIHCELDNFPKILCILPEDGQWGPKHIAANKYK